MLRQLLLDGGALLDAVNRTRRKKIVYRANCAESDRDALGTTLAAAGQLAWIRLDALKGVRVVNGECLPELSRDRFLKCVVLRFGLYEYTVHDLIDYFAHVEGGVHQGSPLSEKDKSLYELAEGNFTAQHFQPGIFALLSVARVVLLALAELRADIEASRPELAKT